MFFINYTIFNGNGCTCRYKSNSLLISMSHISRYQRDNLSKKAVKWGDPLNYEKKQDKKINISISIMYDSVDCTGYQYIT